jgi:hypothetical protein
MKYTRGKKPSRKVIRRYLDISYKFSCVNKIMLDWSFGELTDDQWGYLCALPKSRPMVWAYKETGIEARFRNGVGHGCESFFNLLTAWTEAT